MYSTAALHWRQIEHCIGLVRVLKQRIDFDGADFRVLMRIFLRSYVLCVLE